MLNMQSKNAEIEMFGNAAVEMLLDISPRSLNMIDVGARGGLIDQWKILRNRAQAFGFEPDIEECHRLNASNEHNMRFISAFLDKEPGEVAFKIPKSSANASLYEPLRSLYENYQILSFLEPDKTIKLPCSTLDIEMDKLGVSNVDVLKLDTQGSELRVMQGGTNALSTCFLVDIEVEFNPMYEGQPLFCDVDRFLREQGFVLWRLENLVHYAPSIVPAGASVLAIHAEPSPSQWNDVANGQLFWSQAQYVRKEFPATSRGGLSKETAILASLAVGIYGYWDLAFEIIRKSGDAALHLDLVEALVSAPLSRVPFEANAKY